MSNGQQQLALRFSNTVELVDELVAANAGLATQNAFAHVVLCLGKLEKKIDKVVVLRQQATATVPPGQELPRPNALRLDTFPETRQNALAQLRNTPLMPSFTISLPNSMMQILVEHDDIFHLEQYRHTKHTAWSKALKLAWSKRIYLYDCIVLKADRSLQNTSYHERKIKAASDLDAMRGTMTLDMFMKHLKSHDPDVKKRKRS